MIHQEQQKYQGLTRREFIKGAVVTAGVGVAVVAGLRPETTTAQGPSWSEIYFTSEDIKKTGLAIDVANVEQKWASSPHPEIAALKTPEGYVVGLQVSVPLDYLAGKNEMTGQNEVGNMVMVNLDLGGGIFEECFLRAQTSMDFFEAQIDKGNLRAYFFNLHGLEIVRKAEQIHGKDSSQARNIRVFKDGSLGTGKLSMFVHKESLVLNKGKVVWQSGPILKDSTATFSAIPG